MPEAILYSKGFAFFPKETDPTAGREYSFRQESFDQEVESLFQIWHKRAVNTDGWSYRSRVIDCALRLLGDFHRFASLNASKNPHLYDENYDLLVETLHFIHTGERPISVITRKELLTTNPLSRLGVATPRRLEALNLGSESNFENVIQQWVSWEGGFDDLLLTMHAMFGQR